MFNMGSWARGAYWVDADTSTLGFDTVSCRRCISKDESVWERIYPEGMIELPIHRLHVCNTIISVES